MHARQLGDTLHQIGDRGGEFTGDVIIGRVGILDAVVQQGGDDGFRIQMQLVCHDLGHAQRMGDKGRAVLPLLIAVVLAGVKIGLFDQGKVSPGIIVVDGLHQMVILFLYGHLCVPPYCDSFARSMRR